MKDSLDEVMEMMMGVNGLIEFGMGVEGLW